MGLIHFPQLGGELSEMQNRRCMPGSTGPYYQDAQGVFRCACCGAPLWMPHQQFDQEPAAQWPRASFHSPQSIWAWALKEKLDVLDVVHTWVIFSILQIRVS